jgi:hypothetical protein
LTATERKQAGLALEEARLGRDTVGIMVNIGRLAPCPENLITEPAPEEVAEPTRKGRLRT